jgi:hypothetical protein
MMMGGVGGQTLRVRSARWNHQSAPHTATRRTRPRAHAALLGLDLETVVALALPASGAVSATPSCPSLKPLGYGNPVTDSSGGCRWHSHTGWRTSKTSSSQGMR